MMTFVFKHGNGRDEMSVELNAEYPTEEQAREAVDILCEGVMAKYGTGDPKEKMIKMFEGMKFG